MFGWMLAATLALAPSLPAPEVPEPIPEPAQVLALPAALQQRFQDEVLTPTRSDHQRLERLVEFMFDPAGLNMQYRHDATLTVQQAYLSRQANCLTFTLLVIVLAREAGLEAYAQEIDETLAWYQQDNTIYRSNHVNAGIRVGGRRYTVDVGSDSLIARHPPQRVSDQRLLSHFYNNRAADLMAEGKLDAAEPYMATALDLDASHASSWSNAGVLRLRKNDLPGAYAAYQRALTLDSAHAAALFNLLALSGRSGDRKGETNYRQRLDAVQSHDPFHQFLLAADYERRGDYANAATHYQRAIRLHGSEHRFHFALARAYLQLGDTRRAGRALARAQALGGDSLRSVYQAKLDGLKQAGPRAP